MANRPWTSPRWNSVGVRMSFCLMCGAALRLVHRDDRVAMLCRCRAVNEVYPRPKP